MRQVAHLTAVLVTALSLNTYAGPPVGEASRDVVDRAAAMPAYETGIAAWMWTDKVWYGVNDAITLRLTVKTHGERYPFTLVAYLQNNQTGEKRYFPDLSPNAQDIFGNPPGDFRPVVVNDEERIAGR